MTFKELAAKLSACRVPKDKYSLSGGLPNEKYCIEHVDGKWRVYYSERGSRSGLRIFDSEQEACDYFFEEVTWQPPTPEVAK
jgi:hypothetical protein